MNRLPSNIRPLATTISAVPHQAVPSFQTPTAIVSVPHQAAPSFSPSVIVTTHAPLTVTPYDPKASVALPQAAHDAAAIVQSTSSGMQVSPSGGGGGGGDSPLPSFYDGSSSGPDPDIRTSLSMPVSSLSNPTNAMNAVSKAVAPKSLWQRFLAFLGFGPKVPAVTVHGETGDLRSMVASVVRRARNGDQNAMALMALVRNNAAKGHPRAMESAEHLNEYIRSNPVRGESNPRIGNDGTYADAVALSHGPKLHHPRVAAFLSNFSGEEQQAVAFGILHKDAANANHPIHSQAIRMGKIVGQARSIQAVRERGSSLKAFDPRVAWELE